MLAVNLAYAAIGIVLLAPLPGMVMRLLVRMSGTAALADQDIVFFLLTPFGMASLILVAGIVVAIGALAQASMMFVGSGARGRKVTAMEALAFAAVRSGSILAFSLRLVARVLLIVLPFLAIAAAAAWLLITEYDINYYLSQRPTEFWIAAVTIAGLALVLLVVLLRRLIGWSLSLPLVLFAGVPPARSFAESERLTKGRGSLVLGVMAIWTAVAVVLGGGVIVIVETLGDWAVPRFADDLRLLVVVLGFLVALWGLLSFLATSFNGAAFALAVVEMAQRLGVPIADTAGFGALAASRVRRWKITAPRIAAGLVVAALVAVATGLWLVDGVKIRDDIIVVAHRGAAGKAPENTLASVEQAIGDRADWIEIDVQESADGQVMVVHDSDFMKLAGVNLKVWEGTYEQIRRIDVGGWFGPEFRDERVPTLREVLETARGRSRIVIELKYYGHDQALERRVVDVVESAGMVSDVAVMSLKYEGVQKIRQLRPDWTIGLLSATAIGDLARLDVDFLAVNTGLATAGFVDRAQNAGKSVFVWTVNDPVSMSRMMSLGVDGVITDEPEMAREVLAQRAEMTPVERLLVHTAVLFGAAVPKAGYRDDSP
jgi:glycerophosphoryl diester phosphodiesterase